MSNVLSRFNPSLATLPVYVPGRPIEEVAREHGLDPASIIKLASNENPFGPSPKALVAMETVLRQLHLYPMVPPPCSSGLSQNHWGSGPRTSSWATAPMNFSSLSATR